MEAMVMNLPFNLACHNHIPATWQAQTNFTDMFIFMGNNALISIRFSNFTNKHYAVCWDYAVEMIGIRLTMPERSTYSIP